MNMILILSPIIIGTIWFRVKALMSAFKTKTNFLMESILFLLTVSLSAWLVYFVLTRFH